MFDLAQERGYVKPGECLLKRIVASAGDGVTIDATGVTVIDHRIPNTAPRDAGVTAIYRYFAPHRRRRAARLAVEGTLDHRAERKVGRNDS